MSRFTKKAGAYNGNDARSLPSGAIRIRTDEAFALLRKMIVPNSSSMIVAKA